MLHHASQGCDYHGKGKIPTIKRRHYSKAILSFQRPKYSPLGFRSIGTALLWNPIQPEAGITLKLLKLRIQVQPWYPC